MPTIAPYGSWESPITTDLIVRDAVRLGAIQLDGDVYWAERGADSGASPANSICKTGIHLSLRLPPAIRGGPRAAPSHACPSTCSAIP